MSSVRTQTTQADHINGECTPSPPAAGRQAREQPKAAKAQPVHRATFTSELLRNAEPQCHDEQAEQSMKQTQEKHLAGRIHEPEALQTLKYPLTMPA